MNNETPTPQTNVEREVKKVTSNENFTYEAYRSALEEADKRMKESNGHQYLTILKTRCMNCGRSPRVKTRCGGWFRTFVNILGNVLQEKGVIQNDLNQRA